MLKAVRFAAQPARLKNKEVDKYRDKILGAAAKGLERWLSVEGPGSVHSTHMAAH